MICQQSRRHSFLKLCFFAYVVMSACACDAQDSVKAINQYVHNVWRTEEGLPQNSAQAIVQTHDGYLWTGTEEGLVRFNGAQFTLFNKANTDAFKHNDVRALLEDHNGNLWIGTFGGGAVQYRDARFVRAYTRNEGLSNDFVNALLEDKNGNVWIATNNGLNRLSGGKLSVVGTEAGLLDNTITALAEDGEGNLWIGTNRGLNEVQKGKFDLTDIKSSVKQQVIRALYVDHSGTVWIGTDQFGLYAYTGGRLIQYGSSQGLPKAPILAILQDEHGSLWVGSGGGGLCRIVTPSPQNRFECYTSKQGMSGDSVLSIFEDQEKSIWAGTESGGLNRFKDGSLVTYGAAAGFPGTVRSIYEARDHSLWVALDTGLRRMVKGRVIPYFTSKGPANNYAWAVTEDHTGRIWVGTNEGGLNVFSEKGLLKTYTTRDGLPDNQIHAVFEDHAGDMWIGTERGGVSLFSNGKFTNYSTKQGLANNRVWTIFEDESRRLWFGTDGGLSRFDQGKFVNFDVRDEQNRGTGGVMYVYEDRDHVLWIGTYGSGLKRLANGKLTTYTTRNGLFDDSVWAILEDNYGNFWMSSNLGIFRVSKAELTAFAEGKISRINSVSYGMSDGMLGAECNGGSQNAAWKTPRGVLLFACVRGIIAVSPGSLKSNPLPPPVIIEGALVNGNDVLPGSQRTAAGRGELEFHFAGLSYLAPEKVTFKYKLEGFDRDWVSAATRRVAYYTNIPPGPYTFRVIAANNDGVWNKTGASLSFYLTPRFYQTAGFYIASALLLVIGAIGVYLLRIRAMRKREEALLYIVDERTKDLQQEIAERKKIERDLHQAKETAETATRSKSEFLANMSHEIRTPLNGVIGMVELTRQTELNHEQREFLNMASDSAGALLSVINDILDFSKVEAGKLELDRVEFELADAVTESVRTVALRAHQKKLEITCWIAPELPRFVIADPARLKQILINLLGNAVKFTEKGEVGLRAESIQVNGNEAEIKFSVSDTGPGIPRHKQQVIFDAFSQIDGSTTRKFGGTGLGLAICSRIVALMGSGIHLESEVGKGSVFSFAAKLEIPTVVEASARRDCNPELAGVRALVVDDNQTNRRILQSMLASWGMLPTAVDSGFKALEIMVEGGRNGQPFSLVLVDCRMPGMDGFELVQRIFQQSEISSATVMMLTSDDYHATAQRCREMGIGAYLIKPVKESALFHSVQRLLLPHTDVVPPTILQGTKVSQHPPLRILLAEDNLVNQRLAVRLLEKLGHSVVLADNGRDALQRLEDHQFDLVFMDVQMPEMDGLTATAAIREYEQQDGRHIPIIAMTAHALKGDRERCISMGMDAYVSKPINQCDLIQAIDAVMEAALKRHSVASGAGASQPAMKIAGATT